MRNKYTAICLGLILCITGLGGCLSVEQAGFRQVSMATFDTGMTWSATALYQDQLLYLDLDLGSDLSSQKSPSFYLYNFQTDEKKLLAEISDFALQGRSVAQIEDRAYFYVGQFEDARIKNVLYEMNFSSGVLRALSENHYSRTLIPLTVWDGQLYALQGDGLVQRIDSEGRAQEITLQGREPQSPDITDQYLFSMDYNGEYLCFIEKEWRETAQKVYDPYYYITQYDDSFRQVNKVDITEIYRQYDLDGVGEFFAFGDYFYLSTLSGPVIIGSIEKGKPEVLMAAERLGIEIEYVKTQDRDQRYQYFYKREAEEVYRLDVQTGELLTLPFVWGEQENVQEEVQAKWGVVFDCRIRWILAYGDDMVVIKSPTRNYEDYPNVDMATLRAGTYDSISYLFLLEKS